MLVIYRGKWTNQNSDELRSETIDSICTRLVQDQARLTEIRKLISTLPADIPHSSKLNTSETEAGDALKKDSAAAEAAFNDFFSRVRQEVVERLTDSEHEGQRRQELLRQKAQLEATKKEQEQRMGELRQLLSEES